MAKKGFKPNNAGIRAFLQSPAMQTLCESYARDRAGADGEIKSFVGFDRAKSIIYSSSKEKS